jgi:alkyl hydroperoxide reductase subunit D
MTLDELKAALPDYAKDLRLNLGAIQRSEVLSPAQLFGTIAVAAIASREPRLQRAALAAAREHLSPEALDAARTAAALMGMNNVYYRFVHLVGDAEYGRLPARLRMQGMANPAVPKLDFELWSLAVSAVNGCGACLASHEKALRQAGATPAMIQEAARVAAVIHGAAVVLASEAAQAEAPAA